MAQPQNENKLFFFVGSRFGFIFGHNAQGLPFFETKFDPPEPANTFTEAVQVIEEQMLGIIKFYVILR